MKHLSILGLALTLSLFGCKKSVETKLDTTQEKNLSTLNVALVRSNCNVPYDISLESVTPVGGNYEWVWSVQNPNPGNGSNGTVQNLSHWNITLGECATFSDIISGATSADGITWTAFTPTYMQDAAMFNTCTVSTGNVVKFDYGTSGSAKSYYKLIINKNLGVDMNGLAYYKSGNNTGCGTECFPGFGCPVVVAEGCSYSQGYWFSKPGLAWPYNASVGCQTYTQAEGVAIFKSSNAGGIGTAKKVFQQVAAIKLSGSSVLNTATVWPYIQTAEAWLCTLPKLTTANVKNFNTTTGAAAASIAADSISSWIGRNHCE